MNHDNKLFRITVNDKGYYQYLREMLPQSVWEWFINDPRVTWLPNVDEVYRKNEGAIAFFTYKGYAEFLNKVVNIFSIPFHVESYDANKFTSPKKFLYADDYQVIWSDK